MKNNILESKLLTHHAFMRFFSTVFSLFISTLSFSNSQVSTGNWTFTFSLNPNTPLTVYASTINNTLTFHNGSEKIDLTCFQANDNNLTADFKLYHSSIIITEQTKRQLKGYWHNKSKKGNYRIPFTAAKQNRKTKSNKKVAQQLEGLWETYIDYGKPTKLVGSFHCNNRRLSGTFLSETGDYRFLEGHADKDSMYLQCFDGTHCYLFKGRVFSNDSISGTFYSGKHYQTTWTAVKNQHVTLRSPDSLTYLTNAKKVAFSLPSTNNENYSFSAEAASAAPTIIQIFGTWCPNCVDETIFLKELKNIYGASINIIGIGFERGNTTADKMAHLMKFKKAMGVNYQILLGGNANKKEAAQLFPMLNHVMSFPTLLVIDKQGEIIKVHTGFNGPATGDHYTEFKETITLLVDNLIADN